MRICIIFFLICISGEVFADKIPSNILGTFRKDSMVHSYGHIEGCNREENENCDLIKISDEVVIEKLNELKVSVSIIVVNSHTHYCGLENAEGEWKNSFLEVREIESSDNEDKCVLKITFSKTGIKEVTPISGNCNYSCGAMVSLNTDNLPKIISHK